MRRRLYIAAILVAVAALILIEIFKPAPFGKETLDKSFQTSISRLIGAAVFVMVVIYLGHDVLRAKYAFSGRVLYILPCLAVAVNNLPYVALIRGDARVTGDAFEILFFAVECILVALFEELAFRAALFVSIMRNRRSTKGIFFSIVISSALFGLFHMVNLIYGASIGSVLLQIGYSTLIGCMCAFILLKTQSVWLCATVHAIYNFCGQIVPRLGEGDMLNAPQIIITVIISALCAIYIIMTLIKTGALEADRLYFQNNRS